MAGRRGPFRAPDTNPSLGKGARGTRSLAGTTTTTAPWQQAFRQSGNLRADIQNLAHLPQKAAAARHAHKCSNDHSQSASQVVTNVPYVIPTVRFRYGVCLTTFKALCKKSGMPRWPYRKLKSIDHQCCPLRHPMSLGRNIGAARSMAPVCNPAAHDPM